MLKRLSIWTMTIFVLGAMTCGLASAQDDKLKKEELDQLLAPVALYPDDLLTNVLMASTYPLDVVAADRWRREPANAKLKGDALTKTLEAKDWDPSVKALVQFPDVLKSMSEKLDWTQKLGDAFLAQQSEVMDEIQFLRAKADEAGHLKSTKQQKVVKETGSAAQPVYIIEPATPETIYVPVYQPAVVYGPWWYPAYPPYYWGYPGAAYVNGFFWGAGVAVATGIWGWNHCDWHRQHRYQRQQVEQHQRQPHTHCQQHLGASAGSSRPRPLSQQGRARQVQAGRSGSHWRQGFPRTRQIGH